LGASQRSSRADAGQAVADAAVAAELKQRTVFADIITIPAAWLKA
jgi:hypothetical protein